MIFYCYYWLTCLFSPLDYGIFKIRILLALYWYVTNYTKWLRTTVILWVGWAVPLQASPGLIYVTAFRQRIS